MSTPSERPAADGDEWPDEPVDKILADARPLPPFEETVIEDLTEEEERIFLETIMKA